MWSRSISAGKSDRLRAVTARLAAALLALVAGAAAAQERPVDTLRYPYVAALSRVSGTERVYFCAGALVAPRWILTAAHCFHDPRGVRIGAGDLWAEVGATTLKDVPDAAQVRFERIVVHPDYDPASQASDIALVRLDREAGPLTARIAARSADERGPATALGFGSFYEGALAGRAVTARRAPAAQLSDRLRQAEVPVVRCEADAARLICTSGGGEACLGDSGGPLVMGASEAADRLVGIVSLGSGCGIESPSSVHTRISAYALWIAETVSQQ